jgi:hypothetical protein
LVAGSWRPASTLAQLPAGTPTYNVNAKWVTDRGSQVYNVKAYGATGNGTTDDTAAINATITAAGVGGTVLMPPGSYLVSSQISFTNYYQTLSAYGANIICNLSSATDCIMIGTTAGTAYALGVSILGLQITPGTNTSANSALRDNGWWATIKDVHGGMNTGYGFLHFIENDNDQAQTIDHLYGMTGVTTCNATACGSKLYAAPNGSINAGITWVQNSDFSSNCNGNDIDWQGGNHLTVSHSIFQAWSQFALRTTGPVDIDGWTHWEQGNCTNPLNDGNGHALGGAGLILLGPTASAEGAAPGGALDSVFATNASGGSTSYWYYVVGHTAAGAVTAPLLAGYLMNGAATIGGSAQVFAVWPALTNSSVTTFDLLRTPRGTLPIGTGNWAVATGLSASAACGANGVCAYTDSVGSPSSYTVGMENWYPADWFWPGNLVLFCNPGGCGGNSYNLSTYTGPAVGAMVVDSAPNDTGRIHLAYSAGWETTYVTNPYPFGPGRVYWTGTWLGGSGIGGGFYSSNTFGQDLNSAQTINANVTGNLTGNVTGNVNGNLTGNVTGNVIGNAGTATALASAPSQCSGVQFATGITAGGNANCATPGASATYGGWIGGYPNASASPNTFGSWFGSGTGNLWPMPFSAFIGTYGAVFLDNAYTGISQIGLAEVLNGTTPILDTESHITEVAQHSTNYVTVQGTAVPPRYVFEGTPIEIANTSSSGGNHVYEVSAQITGIDAQPIGGNLGGSTIATYAVNGGSCSGSTATVTTSSGTFATGETVSVNNITPSGFNGVYVLTAGGSGTLSYTDASCPLTWSSGGGASIAVFSGFSTSATANQTETNEETPIALTNGGTISNFCFSANGAPTANLAAYVRHGVGASGAMANTSMLATWNSGVSPYGVACDLNPAHAFTVANGDRIDVMWVGSWTSGTTAGVLGYSAELVPNSPATGMIISGIDGLTIPAGSLGFTGFFTNTGQGTAEQAFASVAPRSATAPNMICWVTGAPTGASHVVGFRDNYATPSSPLTVTITTSFSAPGEQTSTGSDTIAAGDTVNLKHSNSGGSLAATISACSVEID